MNGTAASPAARIVSRRTDGVLVGRPEMRAAAIPQPLRGAFQHDPLRGRDLAQRIEISAGHHPGVQMRQQPGLAQYQPRHLGEVGQRRFVTEPRQSLAGRGVAQFGLVAQGEQSLVAAGRRTGAGDRQHLLGIEIDRLAGTRRVGEGAVMAHIAAQLGQRDKHLWRIRDEIAVADVAQSGRGRHQRAHLRGLAICQRQRLFAGRASRPPRPAPRSRQW